MAITLPFDKPSKGFVHYTEDPTISKCAVALMDFIVKRTKVGAHTTNADIELFSRSTDKRGQRQFSYGQQATATAKKQLEAAGYIAIDRVKRNAKGLRAIKEFRSSNEIPDIQKSPYNSLPHQADNKDFLYVFKRIRDGIYKIGVTGNLCSRASAIACGCGSHVELIAALDTNNAYQIEQELHQCFNTKRLPGEWFELDSSDVNKIKTFFHDMASGGF
jgi:hypothetical protein